MPSWDSKSSDCVCDSERSLRLQVEGRWRKVVAGWWQGGMKAERLRGISRQVGWVINGPNVWDEEKGNPRGSSKIVRKRWFHLEG